MMKVPIMQKNTVLTGTFEPTSDGGFTVSRAAHENGDITTFGQKHQDQNDMAFIGLEPIKGSVKAAGETFVAPLAFPVLDVFLLAPFSVANQCVYAMISNPKVVTWDWGKRDPWWRCFSCDHGCFCAGRRG